VAATLSAKAVDEQQTGCAWRQAQRAGSKPALVRSIVYFVNA